jgi:GNAT superfamily N-acetyltransferase
MAPVIRPLADEDRPWLRDRITSSWGLPVVTPGGTHPDPAVLPGFVAELDGERAGAATYAAADDAWEVVTIEAVRRREGVGRALLTAVMAAARRTGAPRVWLITTDDNLTALAFYDSLGFDRVATHPRFIDAVRAVKPELPADAFVDAVELEWRPG